MKLLSDGITPQKAFPDCVKVDFFKGIALNAVGLSGPGAKALFTTGFWQNWPQPFFLSFMAVGDTPKERLEEVKGFISLLNIYRHDFKAPFGLQINLSCPNVGHRPVDDFVAEAATQLDLLSELKIPLMPKLSVTTPPSTAAQIAEHPACDALCVSNTIPWGQLSDSISWKDLFGTAESPLENYGGGGLSGAPLMPLVEAWVKEARKAKITKPINAGGGILCANDVTRLKNAGASSIFVGSAAFLRPWRVRSIIKRAHQIF